MPKRFTSTEKWDDPWYRKLTPKEKCFWDFLYCTVDNAGVWKIDWDLASFKIGDMIDAQILESLNKDKKRVQIVNDNYLVIFGFVGYQVGDINSDKLTNLQKNSIFLINKYVTEKGFDKDYFIPTRSVPVPYGSRYKGKGKGKHKDTTVKYNNKKVKNSNKITNTNKILSIYNEILGFFNETLKKAYELTEAREKIITENINKGRTMEQMKQAIENFAKDDWPDRYKYCDLIYCLGVRNKIDNFEKWFNYQPKINGQSMGEKYGFITNETR